jgi:hypothetical protein
MSCSVPATNFLPNASAITGPGKTIVWRQNATLGPQEDLSKLKVDATVAVNFTGSGLTERSPILTLHVRAACVDLWKYLADAEKTVSFVTGPPGIGKSIDVYAYALWEAEAHRKRVLYIHCDAAGYFIVLASAGPDNMRVGSVKGLQNEPQFLLDYIVTFLEQREVDIVVLDGRLSWLIESVFACLREFPDVRMISCTSFQAISKLSTEDTDKSSEFSEFVMDSWKKEEYDAAIVTGALVLNSPTLTVDEMFYYAGGSIRMIQWSVARVITTLIRKVRSSPDMGKLIGTGGFGDSSQSAVNSLMAIYEGRSIVLSKFVVMTLLDSVSDDVVEKARAALPYHPPWQGLVTEVEVLNLVRRRHSMLFRNDSGGTEEWPRVRPGSSLPLPTFFNASDPCLSDSKLDWLVPVKFYQECFDAIYRVSPDTVRVIQITNANSHSCKLKYLIPFMEAMNVHIVELVYVCRRSNFDTFKVPIPELKPTGKAKNNSEHQQYMDLKDTVSKIWHAKCNTNDRSSYPAPSIIVRHVTYEQKDRDRPLLEY